MNTSKLAKYVVDNKLEMVVASLPAGLRELDGKCLKQVVVDARAVVNDVTEYEISLMCRVPHMYRTLDSWNELLIRRLGRFYDGYMEAAGVDVSNVVNILNVIIYLVIGNKINTLDTLTLKG